ncbi:hypothetical protein D9757_003511 [Collybiopsis confluens]|uniref:PIK-related kinase FAT domain-containing protein n=1 Tax=Collybiopsis confluens TaxID=2823264 RepID=A0A8H5HTD5_9AGAR|nr:hypothetical protein D9757_003511 [Collybiopsis confluens]
MNFESRIVTLRTQNRKYHDLPAYYERLHELYAALDEGMEGISTMILSPTLEHQIRHHESSGHWTSAQSCWEVRLQQSPDNVEYHLGLLCCLWNLGHYDTLRIHIESAWMVGAWDDVQSIIDLPDVTKSQVVIGRLLLAMRTQDSTAINQALTNARLVLGGPIAAARPSNYRRSYEAMLDLHLTHELETIYTGISTLPQRTARVNPALENLSELLGKVAGGQIKYHFAHLSNKGANP